MPTWHCPTPLSKLHVCRAERAACDIAKAMLQLCQCAKTHCAPCCLLQVMQEHDLNFLQRQHAGLRTLLLDFMTLDTVDCQQVGKFSAGCNRQMRMHGGMHACIPPYSTCRMLAHSTGCPSTSRQPQAWECCLQGLAHLTNLTRLTVLTFEQPERQLLSMIATLTPLRSLHISVFTDPVLLSSLRYSAIGCILCRVASLLNPGHARLAL